MFGSGVSTTPTEYVFAVSGLSCGLPPCRKLYWPAGLSRPSKPYSDGFRPLRTQPSSVAVFCGPHGSWSMNNRAAETFAKGELDQAYWWARGAIVADPKFASTYNTLGVIYRRKGNPDAARVAFDLALERDPDNPRMLKYVYVNADSSTRVERMPFFV